MNTLFKLPFFTLSFIPFSFIAQAQFTVSGVVQDSFTTYPLFGVRMTIFNSDTSFFRETRTAVGDYAFQDIPSGTYSLGASALGKDYRQRAITVSANTANNDFLLPDEIQPGRWDVIVQSPEALGGTDLAILLPNGKIYYCHSSKDPFVFDPVANDTLSVKGDSVVQGCVAPLLLPDGKVIFVGGADVPFYGPGTRNVKTFDFTTDTWTHLPNMLGYRWYPTMTRLTSGKLLVIGGGGQNNPVRLGTSELYNPATGISYYVDTVAIPNELSPIVMLYNGKVLMTHRLPQLFNPSTEQWNTCADFLQGPRMPNGDHADHELVLLPEGNVVAVGYKSFTTGVAGKMIEIYNPLTDSWSYGVNFHPVRSRPKTVLLPDKKILVMAGYKEESANPAAVNNWGYMKLTDLYNPYQDSWRRLADMNYFREYHSLPVLVPDGRIIIVGGEGQPGNEPPFSVIEGFTPPYLFKGVRPEIVNLAQNDFQRGSQINFDVLKTDSVTSVILMSTPSLTHFMNCGNNRYIGLSFTQTGNNIRAAIPTDTLTALDGYYHLIAMVDDIPSSSKIIRIEGENIAPVLNCDSFCVVSITYDTVNANYLYVNISNNDTNFINYPIVQLIDGNDTVANVQKIFEYYGQLPATEQTYHIPTTLDSFPQNWNGLVRLEDGLFHTACIINFPCVQIPNSIRETESGFDFSVYSAPGNEKIIVRISGIEKEGAEIIISNTLGQIIYREKTFSVLSSIPNKDWENGIYLIEVNQYGENRVKKFTSQ